MRSKTNFKISILKWVIFLFLAGLIGYLSLTYNHNRSSEIETAGVILPTVIEDGKQAITEEKSLSVRGLKKTAPETVKALYLTSWVAGTPHLRQRILDLLSQTEANAVVIDVKDETGRISFDSSYPELIATGAIHQRIRDLEELIINLKSNGFYVIARISVFQDPFWSKQRPDLAVSLNDGSLWRDRKGLSWIDPGAVEYWDYIVNVAKASADIGFDELNFDYVRFPSDGQMGDIVYPHSNLLEKTKADILEDFFSYLNKELKITGAVLSIDLFGMTTTNTDDLNIGQVLERAVPYFDFIAPMVYPSHYPINFRGFGNPNDYPYEIVHYSMTSAINRLEAVGELPEKLRPWLQDFDYPRAYTIDDVLAQKRAVYDVGLKSWMIWDPRNIYTKEALESSKP